MKRFTHETADAHAAGYTEGFEAGYLAACEEMKKPSMGHGLGTRLRKLMEAKAAIQAITMAPPLPPLE